MGLLWDTIKSLLKGQPGIGKTTSMDYLLMRALQEGIPVVYETQSNRWYYPPGEDDALKEDLNGTALKKYQDDKDTLLLHDHQPGKEPPIVVNGGLIFAPVSPSSVNYNHFITFAFKVLWMPLPTPDEITAMNVYFRLEPEELRRRVSMFNHVILAAFLRIKRLPYPD